MVYDSVKGTWERLPPIYDPPNTEIPICSQCVAVNRKLLLIGGFQLATLMKSVYIHNFDSVRWHHGADMPTPRAFFVCSVSFSNGLVYVAGGIDKSVNPLASAKAYDVEKDKWEILHPMIEVHGHGSRSGLVEGKFMVLDDEGKSAEVFNPSEGTWRRAHFKGELWRSSVISSSSGGGGCTCSSNTDRWRSMTWGRTLGVLYLLFPFPTILASF